MTRNEAIAIAKAAAAERWTDHDYITDPYDARWADWMPHDWVVDAVMNAADAEPPSLPRAWGVSRDLGSPSQRSVLVSFERELTDDELRTLHDMLAGKVVTA